MRKNVFKDMVMMLFVFIASTTVSKAQMVIDKIDLNIFPAAEKGYKKMVSKFHIRRMIRIRRSNSL